MDLANQILIIILGIALAFLGFGLILEFSHRIFGR